MATYDIPNGIRVADSRFGLQSNTNVFTDPFTRSTQTIEYTGARWVATYTLTAYRQDEAGAIQAFLVKLRGGANRFRGYDPDRKRPNGVGTGTPLVDGGAQTGNTLNTKGWTANVNGLLLPGDYFTVNDELKMVTDFVNSDGSGDAAISFEPSLRSSPSDNAALTLEKAYAVMRLVDDDQAQWQGDKNSNIQISFTGVEVFS